MVSFMMWMTVTLGQDTTNISVAPMGHGSGKGSSGERWKPQVFPPTLPGAIASVRATASSKHVSRFIELILFCVANVGSEEILAKPTITVCITLICDKHTQA